MPVNWKLLEKVDAARDRLGRWLLPPRCLLCAQPGADGHDLCEACAAELLTQAGPRCPRCALPLPAPAPACGICLRRPPPWQAAYAIGAYRFPLDRLLQRFKFHRDLACGRELARLLIAAMREAEHPLAIVPVPLHRERLRERGFDQALELARPLARALALPLQAKLLVRSRATEAQSTLDARSRRRNVRGAFALRASAELPAHVALLDDVLTTGATLGECTRILRRAGVQRVDVWVAARVPTTHGA